MRESRDGRSVTEDEGEGEEDEDGMCIIKCVDTQIDFLSLSPSWTCPSYSFFFTFFVINSFFVLLIFFFFNISLKSYRLCTIVKKQNKKNSVFPSISTKNKHGRFYNQIQYNLNKC